MKFIIKILGLAMIGSLTACGGGGDEPDTPPVENNPPTTPTQIYPANNELCIDNAVTFQWNASTDPEGDAIKYTIEVAKSSSFSPVAESKTVTTTSTTISLEKGVAYYWRVKAVDSKNASSSPSSANSYYTEGDGVSNYVPFAPEIVSPTLGSVVQTEIVKLEWNADDVDTEDNLIFDVYFGKNQANLAVVSSNQSNTNFDILTLEASTKYYWKVVVKDGNGGETKGQIWSFTTD